MKNYYQILGVDSHADLNTIKKAYHKLAKEYHPDSSDLPNANDKFKLIKDAYETLSRENLRRTYDKYMLKKIHTVAEDKDDSWHIHVTKHYNRGRQLYKDGKYNAASIAFQTALNLDKDNPLYCTWLGLTLSHIPNRLYDAKKWCEKAIQISPYNADYLVNLAIVYRDAGITSMADKYFKKALKVDSLNKRANSWLKMSKNSLSIKGMFKGFLKKKKNIS